MVEWLAGNRIIGTNAERISTDFGLAGGWKEVGRFTGGSSGTITAMNVSNLPDKKYYMFLSSYKTNSDKQVIKFNGTSANEYSWSQSTNGVSDAEGVNKPSIIGGYGGSGLFEFGVGYIAHKSNKVKLVMSHYGSANPSGGSSTAPNRRESIGKWEDTTDTISSINFPPETSNFDASKSEVVVLGYDPDDTHTDNFWEELATVELNGNANEMNVTIEPKKYLWVQAFVNTTGAQDNQAFRFNGDTGNNYAWTDSQDGATDVNVHPYNYLRTCVGDDGNNFVNAFIINESTKEKIVISNAVKQSTAGAGKSPERNETVGKWSCEPCTINSIKLWQSGGGSMIAGSIMKVWGHD